MGNITPNISHPYAFGANGKRVQDVYIVSSNNGLSAHLAFVSEAHKTFCGRSSSHVSSGWFLLQHCQKCLTSAVKRGISRVTDCDGTVLDISGDRPVACDTVFETVKIDGVRIKTTDQTPDKEAPARKIVQKGDEFISIDTKLVEHLMQDIKFELEMSDHVSVHAEILVDHLFDSRETFIALERNEEIVQTAAASAETIQFLSSYHETACEIIGYNGVGTAVIVDLPSHKVRIFGFYSAS